MGTQFGGLKSLVSVLEPDLFFLMQKKWTQNCVELKLEPKLILLEKKKRLKTKEANLIRG